MPILFTSVMHLTPSTYISISSPSDTSTPISSTPPSPGPLTLPPPPSPSASSLSISHRHLRCSRNELLLLNLRTLRLPPLQELFLLLDFLQTPRDGFRGQRRLFRTLLCHDLG